jgi:HPt (histidine-containing phosphotransfer) domain-containing protein
LEASAHGADAAAARALDAALARLEESVGDPEFVAEVIGDFLAGLPGQLDALRSAQSAADAEQVHRIAHTLKSNASTFGAEELALACRALEGAAAGGQVTETHELVARVEGQAALATPPLASARDQRLP